MIFESVFWNLNESNLRPKSQKKEAIHFIKKLHISKNKNLLLALKFQILILNCLTLRTYWDKLEI